MSLPTQHLTWIRIVLASMGLLLALVPLGVYAQSGPGASPTVHQGIQAYQQEQFDEAISHLRKAVDRGTPHPQAYAVLALSLLQVQDVAEAETVVRGGTDRLGPHPILRLVQGEVLVRTGQLREALSLYRTLETEHLDDVKNAEASLLSPDGLRTRVGRLHQKLGSQAYADGDTVRARRHLEAAQTRVPESPRLHANLGVLTLQQDEPERALELVRSGLAHAEADDQIVDRLLRLKASALEKTGATDEVAPVYKRLADRNPGDVEIQITYAQALINAGDRRKGLKHFQSLLEAHPKDRRVYEALIDLFDRFRNTENALRVLRRLQEQYPEDLDLLRRIAARLETLHRLEDTRAVYDTVLAQTGDTLEVARAQARTFEAEDNLTAAAAAYRRALRQPSAPTSLYRDLGRVLEASSQWAAALDVYDQWQRTVDEPAPFLHRGRAFERLDEPDSARVAYQAAINRGSDHPLPYARLATLEGQQGRSTNAFDHAVDALRIGLGGDVRLSATPDTTTETEKRVLRAQQRQRRHRATRWQSSVEEAFEYLVQHYPRSQVKPVLDDLLSDHPNVGRLHLLVGQYYDEEGDPNAARQHLRRAAELSPHAPSVHVAMGRVATAQGDTTAALRAYQRAVGLDPSLRAASSALIDLHHQLGRLDALVDKWHQRYETNPTDELRQPLLEALHKAGRYDEARSLARADSTSE